MSGVPIDLAAIRTSDARLDALASEHPEAFRLSAEQWIRILQEQEAMHTTVTKGRPTEGAEHTTQVAIRLPDSMLAALDAFAAEHTEPGRACTRSDAARMILATVLRGELRNGRK